MVDITRVKGFQLDTNARASMVPALSNMLHIPHDNAKRDEVTTNEIIRRLVFDGSFVWGTATSSHRLIKINPQTSTLTYVTGAFSFPYGITYDGDRFVWVLNRDDTLIINASVVKIDKLTDNIVATIPLTTPLAVPAGPRFPRGLAYDGTHIWAAGGEATDVTGFNGFLYRIHATTHLLTVFQVASLTGVDRLNPYDIVYDGSHIWVACYGRLTAPIGQGGGVIKVDPSTGAVVGTYLNDLAYGIGFDGGSVWIGFDKDASPNIVRIDSAQTGAMTPRSTLYSPGTGCARNIFDGKRYMWFGVGGAGAAGTRGITRVDINTNEMFKITPASIGLTSFPSPAFGYGITYDGTHIWGTATDLVNPATTGYVFRLVA